MKNGVTMAEEIFNLSPDPITEKCENWIKKEISGKKNRFLLKLDAKDKKRLEIYAENGGSVPRQPFVCVEDEKPEFHGSIKSPDAAMVAFRYLVEINEILPKNKNIPIPKIKHSTTPSYGYSGF